MPNFDIQSSNFRLNLNKRLKLTQVYVTEVIIASEFWFEKISNPQGFPSQWEIGG